jgi:hypothetical protein
MRLSTFCGLHRDTEQQGRKEVRTGFKTYGCFLDFNIIFIFLFSKWHLKTWPFSCFWGNPVVYFSKDYQVPFLPRTDPSDSKPLASNWKQ